MDTCNEPEQNDENISLEEALEWIAPEAEPVIEVTENTKLLRPILIMDDNKVVWEWDGVILHTRNSPATPEFGYYCDSLDSMFDLLIAGGYIEE